MAGAHRDAAKAGTQRARRCLVRRGRHGQGRGEIVRVDTRSVRAGLPDGHGRAVWRVLLLPAGQLHRDPPDSRHADGCGVPAGVRQQRPGRVEFRRRRRRDHRRAHHPAPRLTDHHAQSVGGCRGQRALDGRDPARSPEHASADRHVEALWFGCPGLHGWRRRGDVGWHPHAARREARRVDNNSD